MTNIELSDVELEAVSGGDFTITVPTPSKETAQKVVNVANTAGFVLAAGACMAGVYVTGALLGAYDAGRASK